MSTLLLGHVLAEGLGLVLCLVGVCQHGDGDGGFCQLGYFGGSYLLRDRLRRTLSTKPIQTGEAVEQGWLTAQVI